MKQKYKFIVVAGIALTFAMLVFAKGRSSEVLWLDFDMKSIPEPKERESGYYEYFFKGHMIEGSKQYMDIPRWIRRAAGNPKQAANVNAVDEVPNSSWYTNRHRMHRLSLIQLQRAANTTPPDFSEMEITRAKIEGASPGMMVKDARGDGYLIKFDPEGFPNLQSAAEIITTKIMYASGYNVAENYIAYIVPANFKIGKDVKIMDSKTGKDRPLNMEDVEKTLKRVSIGADGRVRVMASRLLSGKSKGPFPQVGLRTDDPNDLIPHEHRRELRSIHVISSWINNWDLKEPQSLDMYVEENGRKFLRHYLIDFGSSLGADEPPLDTYHGKIYGLDLKDVTTEVVTLGVHKSPREVPGIAISPEIGTFTADDFDPGSWKQTYGSVMFSNVTAQDAFWAVRIILSFSESDLRSIIECAEYSDPKSNDYMLQTLMKRREIVARYWLGKVDGLSEFSVAKAGSGVVVRFKDLVVDNNLGLSSGYTYQVKGKRYTSGKQTVHQTELAIDRAMLSAAIEKAPDEPVEVEIWPTRGSEVMPPVRIYFDWSPTLDVFRVRRIDRS